MIHYEDILSAGGLDWTKPGTPVTRAGGGWEAIVFIVRDTHTRARTQPRRTNIDLAIGSDIDAIHKPELKIVLSMQGGLQRP